MNLYIIMGMVGPWQIVIIMVALLLFFGGKKIPELMKGLGQGMKEFKKATSEMKEEMDTETSEKSENESGKEA